MSKQKATPKQHNDQVATRISVTFSPGQYRAIVDIAKRNNVSAAWVVRHVVNRHLESQAPLFAGLTNAESTQ
jgi:hypothetical protein